MSFEKLLADLDALHDLQKSDPAADLGTDGNDDDAGIAAAAADGDDDRSGEGDGEGDAGNGEGEGEGEGEGDKGSMAKSFSFTLENGEEIDAIDGTELVKSLIDRLDASESQTQKAMGSMLDLMKSMSAEIKAQRSEIARIGAAGRGRKTVVSVAEKPQATTLAKSEPAGLSGQEFMAKALDAQKVGKITGLDVARAEASLLKGLPVNPSIVSRVLS